MTSKRREPAPPQDRHTPNNPTAAQYIAGLHRRRNATDRIPPYGECSCRDPWTCWCRDNSDPTERRVDGYRDAVLHLLSCGLTPAASLPEIRTMFRRKGTDARLAMQIAEHWEVAA
jgi:hypothetical protein